MKHPILQRAAANICNYDNMLQQTCYPLVNYQATDTGLKSQAFNFTIYIYILFGDFCLLKCDHMFFLWDRIGYNQHTMGIPSYTLRVINLGWQGNP